MVTTREIEAVLREAQFEQVGISIYPDAEGFVLATVMRYGQKFQFQPPNAVSYVVSKYVQRRTSMMLVMVDDVAWFKYKGLPPLIRAVLRDTFRLPLVEHVPILQ